MKKIIVIVILAALLISTAAAEKPTEAWVMCQPDSQVNVRANPKNGSEVVAYAFPGDRIELSGKKKGRWYHCFISCEAGEGWIRSDFLSFYEPEIYPDGKVFVTTHGKLYARRSIGGTKRMTLKKGVKVTVYMMAAEWSVTDKGYIMTEFLEEVEADGEMDGM